MKVGGGGGGGGGNRESHQMLLAGITSKHSKGDRLNFTLFSPKSSALPSPPPLQAINNDQSLRGFYGYGKIREIFLVMCFIHMQKKMYSQQLKLGMCGGGVGTIFQ